MAEENQGAGAQLLANVGNVGTEGGAGANNGAANAVVRVDRTPNFRIKVDGKANNRDSKWYLKDTDELADVTDEASNLKIGLVEMQLNEATANQLKAGIVCKVNVKLGFSEDKIIAQFYGIPIMASQFDEGAIRIQFPGRKWENKFLQDYVLSTEIKAQILRRVHKFTVPAEVPAAE